MLAAVMDALEDDDIELVKTLVGCRVMGMVLAHKFPQSDGSPNWRATLSLQPAQMAGINLTALEDRGIQIVFLCHAGNTRPQPTTVQQAPNSTNTPARS